METKIQNNQDLFNFLISRANSGSKNWFSFTEQHIAGIDVAYKMAIAHADKMTPTEVVDYVQTLNNTIYAKMIKG